MPNGISGRLASSRAKVSNKMGYHSIQENNRRDGRETTERPPGVRSIKRFIVLPKARADGRPGAVFMWRGNGPSNEYRVVLDYDITPVERRRLSVLRDDPRAPM